jgi:hypothetical protein
MMADLGLALLAGLGAFALARAAAARWPARRHLPAAVFAATAVLLLFEQRVAPLPLMRGAADPDETTEFLKRTAMRGGIVDLPTSFPGPYEAMLRAADHGRPLVNAVSGFTPPIVERLEQLLASRPIPEALLDHLESIPASYVVVHESRLLPDELLALRAVLSRGLATDRLRFAGRFDGRHRRNDVYAVTKTEPKAAAGKAPPWDIDSTLRTLGASRADESLVGSVDGPSEGEVVRGRLLVRGWARSEEEDLQVSFLFDGELRVPASFRRVSRPDVAHAFRRFGTCETAGYEAEFPFGPGDEGKRELRAVFRTRNGRFRLYTIRAFRWGP